jgi:hypothetical protein
MPARIDDLLVLNANLRRCAGAMALSKTLTFIDRPGEVARITLGSEKKR